MSRLGPLLQFAAQLSAQEDQRNAAKKPSRIPEIVATALQNRLGRQQIKQQAVEAAMKERIAGQQAQVERERTSASSQAAKLDALSRLYASGEDVPPELAAFLMQDSSPSSQFNLGMGGLNISGPLNLRGGKVPYMPPAPGSSGKQFIRDLAQTKSADDVRELISQYPNLSPKYVDAGLQRMNQLESGREALTLPGEKETEEILEGNVEGRDPRLVDAVLSVNENLPKNKEKQQTELLNKGQADRAFDVARNALIDPNATATQYLESIYSAPEKQRNAFLTDPSNIITLKEKRSDWIREKLKDLENDQNKSLSGLDSIVNQGIQFGIKDNDPNMFYNTYEKYRNAAVEKELKNLGRSKLRFNTKKGAREALLQMKKLNEIEARVGLPNVLAFPKISEKYTQTGSIGLPGFLPPNVTFFPGTTRATPETAETQYKAFLKAINESQLPEE